MTLCFKFKVALVAVALPPLICLAADTRTPQGEPTTASSTSYREGDWKVVYHYFPSIVSCGAHYQLFNLRDDPFEQRDLAATKPSPLRRMMQGLIAGLERQGALYPVYQDGTTPLKPKLPRCDDL